MGQRGVEIHKPKPWHGWREFAKEIVTIVIGVLIALSAEQVVEWLHHGEQATRAERAMRLELGEDNGPQAFGRVLIRHCLDRQLAQIQEGSTSATADELRAWTSTYSPPRRTWDTEAWKVVVASDVGNFMGAERLVEWSAAYRMLPLLTETNYREGQLATEMRNALPPTGDISEADRQNLRRLVGALQFSNGWIASGSELLLSRARRLGAAVPVATQQDLLNRARALYGACVVTPDPSARPRAQNPTANLRAPLDSPASANAARH